MNRVRMAIKNRFCFFVFWIFFLFPLLSHALDIPSAPTGRVNDYAGMLDASSRAELEQTLKAFEDSTSNQIVVATFPSLDGEALEDFSIRLGEKWKVGQKGRDNGVLLLIFKNDRKIQIEAGYGLEGALTDATSKSIIQNQIIPYFKQGDFKGGIFAGVNAIMEATKGEYKGRPPSDGSGLPPILIIILIFFLFILISTLARKFSGRSGTFSSGGGAGGWSSGRSSWGSSGGGFSGGGGSFGGGGASGSW